MTSMQTADPHKVDKLKKLQKSDIVPFVYKP
jgi:hypothetical protein